MLTFNVQDGFTEGIVRGYRSGFLKDVDYFNLCECTKLDDVRMNLSETDYGRFLEDVVRFFFSPFSPFGDPGQAGPPRGQPAWQLRRGDFS